ncbi:MAG: nuclear transport factor 2 family protein [Clostridiales bacterium]|nr:nuclear transport factor 2 family protein [Clostridiales bacterium]
MFEGNQREIAEVIGRYFDASYHGSGQGMLGVFHAAAHIYGRNEQGGLIDWPAAEFARLVDSGTAPAATNQPREDEIVSICFTGEQTAVAIVKLRLFQTRYTDILTFLSIDGNWRVIAKALSAEKVEAQ